MNARQKKATFNRTLESLYAHLIYFENLSELKNEGRLRVRQLCKLHRNSKTFLRKYVSQFDEEEIYCVLAAFLVQCITTSYNKEEFCICAFTVLKENLSHKMYMKILEKQYLRDIYYG